MKNIKQLCVTPQILSEIRNMKSVYGNALDYYFGLIFPYFEKNFLMEDIRLIYLRKMMIHPEFLEIYIKKNKKFSQSNKNLQLVINHLIYALADIVKKEKNSKDREKIVNNVIDSNYKSNFFEVFSETFINIFREVNVVNKKVVIMSLGCGIGDKENTLDFFLKKYFKNTRFQWVGFDEQDYEDTFFHKTGNRYINSGKLKLKKNILNSLPSDILQKDTIVIILAINSIHHMILSISRLLNICRQANGIILYEEPVKDVFSNSFLYYSIRLAYDILANYSFDGPWPNAFMINPNFFNVKYLQQSALEKYFNFKVINSRSPESYIYWKIN